MVSRFHLLIESLAKNVERDYGEAREHARNKDPQRAGHEGESTWQRLLTQWGPGWPVVTRKYIVGPGGETNEVDVILLKPDYPAHLRDEPSILVSGIAAAFSSKLTLRKDHIAEALAQKKRILEIGGSVGSVREVLCGKFPFGILSHSSAVLANSSDFDEEIKVLYEQVAHGTNTPLVTHPSEELDALLVADRGFFSSHRASYAPSIVDGVTNYGPSSMFMNHSNAPVLPGTYLAQFITWSHSVVAGEVRTSSLESLREMFEANLSNGYSTPWPMGIYPDHYRENIPSLVNEFGFTRFY